MAELRGEGRTATVQKHRRASSEKKSLGTVYDQRFYALRRLPSSGGPSTSLSFPFPPSPFNGLICVGVPLPEAALGRIMLALLQHGMRQAVCCGCEAEFAGDVLDELIDEHNFSHDGHAPFASVHEGEPLSEVIDYFILPNGLADIGLLMILGDEAAFGQAVKAFGRVAGQLRERLHVPAR